MRLTSQILLGGGSRRMSVALAAVTLSAACSLGLRVRIPRTRASSWGCSLRVPCQRLFGVTAYPSRLPEEGLGPIIRGGEGLSRGQVVVPGSARRLQLHQHLGFACA